MGGSDASSESEMSERQPIPVTEIVAALEREAANTDTDPRWMAAQCLRHIAGWETRTLMCRIDTRPSTYSAVETGRDHPPGSCLIGGDCDHVKETAPEYCDNCGHSYEQHTKGPVQADYCRHCPCQKWTPANRKGDA